MKVTQPLSPDPRLRDEPIPDHACPIAKSLRVIGDRWTLLILRDMVFEGRRHFSELAAQSPERISTNVLADRLRRLVGLGFLTRRTDPSNDRRVLYSLTEPAIRLIPVLASLGEWGNRYLTTSGRPAVRAAILMEWGEEYWRELMTELREIHVEVHASAEMAPALVRLDEAITRRQARAP